MAWALGLIELVLIQGALARLRVKLGLD